MTGHEFVVEGRPELNVDWKAEYAKQRKCRLADSIHEYLEDDDVSLEVFYQDLKDEIEEIITYHKLRKEKAMSALELILGHRPVNLEDISNSY
jgi:hypothetical protein